MNEEYNESKAFYTDVARVKSRQNGHNKQMYWTDSKGTEYFVEMWSDSTLPSYTKL